MLATERNRGGNCLRQQSAHEDSRSTVVANETTGWTSLPPIRWLVSNPPYIPANERPEMAPHVVDAEPALALFVPDSDPLVFYYAIAEFARYRLMPGITVGSRR